MYTVSNDYLTAMMSHSTRRRLKGFIGTVAFTGDDIIQGTFEVSNRCAEKSNMIIGGVYIGTLSMTLKPSFISKIPRDEYQGKDVTASIGLLVGNTWVDVPLGHYILQSPKISKNGISVEGYDYMSKLDKTFPASQTGGTMWDLLYLISTDCGIDLAFDETEVRTYVNGDINLGIYAENDIETYRDLLYWIAQAACRFATFNRDGELELRKFGVPNSVVLDEMHRDTDVVFSGYTTKWTGISVVDMATQTTMYYGLEVDDGLTMNLGSNPLLQYGLPEIVDKMRTDILEELSEIQYTPYTVNSARDPIFDLGDEIEFDGGISGDSTGCVMSFTYNLDSYSFEGYGDDPALSNGRSKTDKNIAGLLSQVDSDTLRYYYFENATAIDLGENVEMEIAKLKFAAKKTTDVNIWHEFKILTESSAEEERTLVYHDEEPEPPEEEPVTEEIGYFDEVKYSKNPIRIYVKYYYDGVLQDYQPIESWSEEGYHTLHLAYFLRSVDITQQHEWKVTVTLTGGSGTIGIEDAHILLSGQGMVGDDDKWDGTIDVEDETGYYDIAAMSVHDIVEGTISTTFVTYLLNDTIFTDTVGKYDMDSLSVKDTEDGSLSVVLRNIVFGLVTEDGLYNIVSADGNYIITTED